MTIAEAMAAKDAELAEALARVRVLEEAIALFLLLMDDPDYDFGELCEEAVPRFRAALRSAKG